MRKLFYFLAMSAVVLGMAFTFNACGGNDANNPENPKDPEIDPNSSLTISKSVVEFPQRGGVEYLIYVKSTAGIPSAKVNEKPWLTITPVAKGESLYGIDKLHHLSEELTIEVAAGAPDETTVIFSNDETSVKMVIRRNDSCDPGYEYRNSPTALEGTASGKFSTGPGCAVYFSKGNLQYHVDDQIWRFAEKQTDVVNKGAYTYADEYELEKEWNHGWMDLFYWLSGKYPAEEKSSYYTFNDLNDQDIVPISNGGNKEGIWHSLTGVEWEYLFFGRDRANELYGQGTVNGQKGMILLPDNWVQPAGIPTITPPNSETWVLKTQQGVQYYGAPDESTDHYADNAYTANEWKTMEEKGAVFLPAIYDEGWKGMQALYQANQTSYPASQGSSAYFLLFNKWEFYPRWASFTGSYDQKNYWVSVRLVRIAQP